MDVIPDFYCWTDSETIDSTAIVVEGEDAKDAAQSYARQHTRFHKNLGPIQEKDIVVFVVPEDRPHRCPDRFSVRVAYNRGVVVAQVWGDWTSATRLHRVIEQETAAVQ